MLIIPGLPSRFTRLTKAVLWAFRVKELDIDGHFGMGDPFAAGVTFGVISAMRASVKLPANYHIQIVPSFASDIFLEGYAHLDVSVRPVKLLAPAVLFGLSSPGRRLLQLSLFHRESIKIVRHRRLDR